MKFSLIGRMRTAKTSLIKRMRLALMRGAAASGWRAAIYYTMFSSAFRREQKAVLSGILQYEAAAQSENGNLFLLKRNIHRLEKGLTARARRPIFALDYIAETVATYAKCARRAAEPCQRADLVWAADVLDNYFHSVAAHPVIDAARAEFRAVAPQQAGAEPHAMRSPSSAALPPEAYATLTAICAARHAVRWFQPQPVPREVIDSALRLACAAPSACNRQPIYYHVFDHPDDAAYLAAIPVGARDFAQNIPALAALVGDLSAFHSERDRHIIYLDAALSAMTFMYALETLGVSSCPINWPDMAEPDARMTSLLRLRPHERVLLLIAVGYADPSGLIAHSQKKDLADMRRFYEHDSRMASA